MKKIIALASLIVAASFNAQVKFKETRYGVTGGVNYSAVRNAHNPSGKRWTGQIGALALTPVGTTDQFYIQTEVSYYGAGETGKDPDAKGRYGYDAVYANNYISVPVLFKAYLSESENEFFAALGPRFSFLINQNVKNVPPEKPYYAVDGAPGFPNVNGKAAGFWMAIDAKIGYSYKRQYEVYLGADLGMTNVYPGLKNEPGSDPAIAATKNQHVISLGLSYIFP